MTRPNLYDIRGNLSSWEMGLYSQQLGYGDVSGTPDWTGRITKKSSRLGAYRATYSYQYNPLGFLTRADYINSRSSSMNFSAAYAYDLQGNLTEIKRAGMLVGNRYGMIENSVITRDGNRIGSVRVKGPADEPMENQTVIQDNANMYGYGFEYDANGNLVSDPGRGITEIVYSESGCPLTVTFQDGEEIRFAYTASGEKLREVFIDSDGTVIRTRDLRGNFEFADGELERVQIEDGYLNATGEYVVSVKDYQGNVVAQINASTGASLQHTDYYPYGLPMGISTGAEQNRRKFGDKEYTSEFGFASSDFGARLYTPLYGSFASPDPKAGDYAWLSPYTYCASDPINLIDPTGEDIWIHGDNDSQIILKMEQINASVDLSALGIDWGGTYMFNGADVVSAGLDIVGVFDPTGATDAANAAFQWNNGDWLGAVTSAISIVPGGDILKSFKITKDLKIIEKAITSSKSYKSTKSARQSAVRKAWKEERDLVEKGGGSRRWKETEKLEILNNGKVKGYQGHHINSVKDHPGMAGDPNNVLFLTPEEHLNIHCGNFRNQTKGKLLNRKSK